MKRRVLNKRFTISSLKSFVWDPEKGGRVGEALTLNTHYVGEDKQLHSSLSFTVLSLNLPSKCSTKQHFDKSTGEHVNECVSSCWRRAHRGSWFIHSPGGRRRSMAEEDDTLIWCKEKSGNVALLLFPELIGGVLQAYSCISALDKMHVS